MGRYDRMSTFYTIMCLVFDGGDQDMKFRPQAKLEIMFGTHHR